MLIAVAGAGRVDPFLLGLAARGFGGNETVWAGLAGTEVAEVTGSGCLSTFGTTKRRPPPTRALAATPPTNRGKMLEEFRWFDDAEAGRGGMPGAVESGSNSSMPSLI